MSGRNPRDWLFQVTEYPELSQTTMYAFHLTPSPHPPARTCGVSTGFRALSVETFLIGGLRMMSAAN